MIDDPVGLLRVEALHSLTYCERLYYLQQVEEISNPDEAVYAGRALHEELRAAEEEEGSEWTAREVTSEALGLTGKLDCLRRRDGTLIPYEHKRGRCRRDGKIAAAWASDSIQALAYALLLEEEIGRPVPEARIRYHAENVTVRVVVDDAARASVRQAVDRARHLRASLTRPPITSNDRLCLRCSLAPICLPEEDRFATEGDWEPVRLFPPERDLRSLHVVEPGARVGKSDDTLTVDIPAGESSSFPIEEIGAVVLHGAAQISTQAIALCAARGIGVHFLSAGGKYITAIAAESGSVQRRIRQYAALADADRCRELGRRLASAKVENTLKYLLRATAGNKRSAEVEQALTTMRGALSGLAEVQTVDGIRGHEGMAARAWFGVVGGLLRADLAPEFLPTGRNRRPPRDRFNALLSFGYALLYQHVMAAIRIVGLEPALGFYHTPRSSAHPLVLDLMELFRLPLWDIPLLGSLNRLQWDVAADFQVAGGRVWLSSEGRRKAIRLFESRLDEQWKHPVLDYSLSYARLTELEVRLLEKEWTDHPGLFARMRIR
jgi:CRISPR-associated protein Cas1